MYTFQGLGVRVVREGVPDMAMDSVCCPEDAVKVIQREVGNEDREMFLAVLLNARFKVLGINTVAIGTLNSCLVHPREVFKPAIVMGAHAIIVCHNHPSGDAKPSPEDIDLTKRLHQAATLLGFALVDHVVLTQTESISLREMGHMPIEVELTETSKN